MTTLQKQEIVPLRQVDLDEADTAYIAFRVKECEVLGVGNYPAVAAEEAITMLGVNGALSVCRDKNSYNDLPTFRSNCVQVMPASNALCAEFHEQKDDFRSLICLRWKTLNGVAVTMKEYEEKA